VATASVPNPDSSFDSDSMSRASTAILDLVKGEFYPLGTHSNRGNDSLALESW